MSPSHKNLKSTKVVYTLGTSQRTFDQFLELLAEYQIAAGVDIRSFPTSRFPHFSKEALARGLESRSIEYLHLGNELGGFRKGGYRPYVLTSSFQTGLERLEKIALEKKTVFFCSEQFPWKCHRRWVSQALMERGWEVIHILGPGKVWIQKPGRMQGAR